MHAGIWEAVGQKLVGFKSEKMVSLFVHQNVPSLQLVRNTEKLILRHLTLI